MTEVARNRSARGHAESLVTAYAFHHRCASASNNYASREQVRWGRCGASRCHFGHDSDTSNSEYDRGKVKRADAWFWPHVQDMGKGFHGAGLVKGTQGKLTAPGVQSNTFL